MKTYNFNSFLWLSLIILGNISVAISQVGINTTTPRKALEVGGDMKVSNQLLIGSFNKLESADTSTLLVQKSDGNLNSLDPSGTSSSPLAYIQNYVIVNPDEDWVRDFDTGIDATDYVLVTVSANFDQELLISSATGAVDNASLPYTSSFIQGGTWHIIADYPMTANNAGINTGTWTIKTLIFSKQLSKQLGVLNIPMANSTTGSASSPILD